MITFVILDDRGVEAVFLGDRPEVTPAKEKELRGRLDKIGYKLVKQETEPLAGLEGFVEWLEAESGDDE